MSLPARQSADVEVPLAEAGRLAADLARYDYDLPAELVAQVPVPRRDGARLLVLDRARGALRHRVVRELPALVRPGDLLVFNDARVRPARLFGRSASGGAVELLLVSDLGGGRWQCLGRPARRLRCSALLSFPAGATAEVEAAPGRGRYQIQFAAGVDVSGLLARHGELPLPPYIKRPDGPLAADRDRYQTVFAAREAAVAAPTAGLHFTVDLLDALRDAGAELAWLTLEVGPATFLPVRDLVVAEHGMEPEWAEIPARTARAVSSAKQAGRRVIAVGTTTTRALESGAARPGGLREGGFWADSFILPGIPLRVVDGLLTNFHLPRSTPLMLVSALAGQRSVLAAYGVAVRERYRFYSYGDAMVIL